MLEYLLVAGENDDAAAADALVGFVERRAQAFAALDARFDAAGGGDAAVVAVAEASKASAAAAAAVASELTGKAAKKRRAAGEAVSRKAAAARKPFVNLIPYNPTAAGDKFGCALAPLLFLFKFSSCLL
jgi:adenine C2-methylase RlmN of 23S rRNA A2503 and tRNA A37